MKEPSVVTPDNLFQAGARYKAPVFQRLYVWGKQEFESLIEDIENADPDIGQFLGAIVIKDLGREKGPASPSSYLIIDGQQRLTTLYLILLALSHIAAQHNRENNSTFITQTYLAETKSPQFKGWPKLVPTLQDRQTLWSLLEQYAPQVEWNFAAEPGEQKPRAQDKLSYQWKRIYEYFKDKFVDASGNLQDDMFEESLRSIQEYLRFICITLEETDDANSIFGRLNARGVPLDLSDLVRNEVFTKFKTTDAAKAEKFFDKKWHVFEKTFPAETLSQFFPVYAYIIFRGKVTKSAAFPRLQKKWKSTNPQSILNDLQRYSAYYCALVKYTKLEDASPELNEIVEHFARMPRTTVTWPFLIETIRAAVDRRLDMGEAALCLRIVESFLVRRALLGLEPTGLHAVFKSLWAKTEGQPSEVLKNIVTATIKCPSNKALQEVLTTKPSDSRVIVKYVLSQYERSFSKKRKFDQLSATAITIEHVLPQNLAAAWTNEFNQKAHAECVGLLGNLVALSEAQNKSLQDQPWKEKKKRFRGSNFKSTQALAKKAAWTPQVIRLRTRELADWIAKEWPDLGTFRTKVK